MEYVFDGLMTLRNGPLAARPHFRNQHTTRPCSIRSCARASTTDLIIPGPVTKSAALVLRAVMESFDRRPRRTQRIGSDKSRAFGSIVWVPLLDRLQVACDKGVLFRAEGARTGMADIDGSGADIAKTEFACPQAEIDIFEVTAVKCLREDCRRRQGRPVLRTRQKPMPFGISTI